MIHAIDNQMRKEWERAGRTPVSVKVFLHPDTADEFIRPYTEHSLIIDYIMLRWGRVYVTPDLSLDKGLAILQFVRKARSDRPEDV